MESGITTIEGTAEIYASITRVGGKRPTANLALVNGEVDSFQVQNHKLAKELAKHLNEMVKLNQGDLGAGDRKSSASS